MSETNNKHGEQFQLKTILKTKLLILLVLQGSAAILTGRYTRTFEKENLYEISHLVFVIECVKLMLSALIEFVLTGGKLQKSIYEHILKRPGDSCKLLLPAGMYVIQNSLLYVALSNLTAPVFVSLQQSKLVATAIVSVVLLHRSYSAKQWLCLLMLGFGVAMIAVNETHALPIVDDDQSHESQEIEMEDKGNQNFSTGFLAVVTASFSSAFAGVYFERILAPNKRLKGVEEESSLQVDQECANLDSKSPAKSEEKSSPSLWIRNMQLSFFSLLFVILQNSLDLKSAMRLAGIDLLSINDYEVVEGSDDEEIKPFFYGFSFWVWVLVLLQALGGLLVSAIIKYSDNVIKGLAMGISVVVASSFSTLLFGTKLSSKFSLGSFIILVSAYLFSNDLPSLKKGKSNKKPDLNEPLLPLPEEHQ